MNNDYKKDISPNHPPFWSTLLNIALLYSHLKLVTEIFDHITVAFTLS